MRVLMFSAKRYDRDVFEERNQRHRHDIQYIDVRLDARTAGLAAGFDAVCIFVNDVADADAVASLADVGVRAIALRCAGFNNVDVDVAAERGIAVVRVPSYSPESVAEHTLALILALDRHVHRAYQRVREGNFALDGLLGRGLHGSTAGVVGTGQIGHLVAKLLVAFGCDVLAHDPVTDPELVELGVRYVTASELLARADILTLTCPLTPDTFHLVNAASVATMKLGVMLINTGRGALVDTTAVIDGLKSGQIGSLAIDVYEEEGPLFFEDRSAEILLDDVFARLLTFPNVLITAHQAFFTRPALERIADTTLANLDDLDAGRPSPNRV